MASHYDIRPNAGKYDVYWRSLFTKKELQAKEQEFIKYQGMDSLEAEIEVWSMAGTFAKCNKEATDLWLCMEYVSSYVQPGDTVTVGGRVYVVNRSVLQESSKIQALRNGSVVEIGGTKAWWSKEGRA